MKRLFVGLCCFAVVFSASSMAGAVGKVTSDPNNPDAAAAATAEVNADPLAQKVTLVVSHKPVKTVLAILSASTKVTLKAGFNDDDWQVRDRKMTLAVRDMPLSEVMDKIAQVMKFKWRKGGKKEAPVYRLYLDRQTLLGNDALGYRAQEVYEELCKKNREDFVQEMADLEKMSDADVEKLKDTNFYLYWLRQNGSDKLINSMFKEIPGLADSFKNIDTNFDGSASVLSEEAQQQLMNVIMQRWKSSDQYHNCTDPFPADKIGAIKDAELIVEHVPRPFDDWRISNEHWDFGGIGIYLKDGFHKLVEFTDPSDPRSSLDSKQRCEAGEAGVSRKELDSKYNPLWEQAEKEDKKALEAIFPTEPDVEHQDEPDLHIKLKEIKPASQKLDDVLVALSEASGFTLISDSFASVKGTVTFAADTELVQALDAIAKAYRYNWQKDGNVITFRSRDWFSFRMSQLPDEWVEKWQKDIEDNEFLSLESFSAIACLDARQVAENVTPNEVLAASKVIDWPLNHSKNIMRLYAVLNSTQRKALFSDTGLCLKSLQPHQIEAARRAFRYRNGWASELDKMTDYIKDEESLKMTLKANFAKAGKLNCGCNMTLANLDGSDAQKWYIAYPHYTKPGAPTADNNPVTIWNGMIKSGKLKEAKEAMEKALKESNRIETADAVSAVMCDNGMAKEAIAMWENRIKQAKEAGITPAEEADYYTRLAWASGSAKDLEKEEEARKHVTEIGIKTKDARRVNSLAWFYASKGIKLDQAMALSKQAIELAPEDPGFRSTLATIYSKKGDYATAIDILEMCINKLKAVDNAPIRFQLAEAYAKTGKVTEAKAELEKARGLGFDPKEIDRVTESLK